MLVSEVLVREFRTVDALTTCAVANREVSTLSHELINDSVEWASLEMKRLATLAHSLLSSAESTEVL